MHRALKATTCLIFHGHCASCLYFLLRYHFPCRSKVPQTVSPREAAVRLGVTANLADNKRLSLGAVSGDKSCGGEGGEPRVSTSGTVQKVTSRSFAARALTHCERLRYSLLPVRVRPFHAKARKEERWERGIVFLSPSHSLSLPSSLFLLPDAISFVDLGSPICSRETASSALPPPLPQYSLKRSHSALHQQLLC